MKSKLAGITRDVLVVAGSAAIIAGLAKISLPLSLIVGGLAMALLGVGWEIDRQHRAEIDRRNRRDGV